MKSIRPRFLLVSGFVIALSLAATAFAFTYLFERALERQIDADLTNIVNQIAAGLDFDAQGKLKEPAGLADKRFHNAYGGLYWQIDDFETGDVLRSRSLWDFVLALPEDTHDAGAIHRYYLPGPDQGEVYAQERSLIVATPTGARSIRIAVAIDKTALSNGSTQFAYDLIPYLATLGLFLLTASAFQLAWGLKPLAGVSNDLKHLADQPNRRLDRSYPLEISHLVDAVNGLLDAQEKTIEQSRKRAADLAHGLKTPLTVLANNAEKLRARGLEEMAEEISTLVKTMEANITHELARSRIAAGPGYRKSDANLSETLSVIARTLAKTPKGESVKWRTNVPPDVWVKIDPNDLRELLGNILENAVKWAAGEVVVIAAVHGATVRLSVEDDGPGIATDKITEMMDRGKRFDEKIPGTGLGLAIVRDIAEAYGLTLTIQNRQTNGLCVVTELPLAVSHAGHSGT